VLVSGIMIAQAISNNWSELLTSVVVMKAERSASQNAGWSFRTMWAIRHRITGPPVSSSNCSRCAQSAENPQRWNRWNRIVLLSAGGWLPHGTFLERCWRSFDHRFRKCDHKWCARFADWLPRDPGGFA